MTVKAQEALQEIDRLREWIVMAENRLECKNCKKCVDVARSYLQEALKTPKRRKKIAR